MYLRATKRKTNWLPHFASVFEKEIFLKNEEAARKITKIATNFALTVANSKSFVLIQNFLTYNATW